MTDLSAGQLSPDLAFTVTGARAARCTAVPTLEFQLDVVRTGGGPVRSVLLSTAIRIAPGRRRYDRDAEEGLAELFGAPERWATTVGPLAWAQTTTVVPPFDDRTSVVLPVPCNCDIELAVTKYFRAVKSGDVPLDFLFSGTVFHTDADGALRTAQISWANDAAFRLPAALWQAATGRHGADGGWIRLSQDSYERLDAYRARHAFTGWDQAALALLDRAGTETETETAGASWTL